MGSLYREDTPFDALYDLSRSIKLQDTPLAVRIRNFVSSTCAYVVVWVGGLEVWELMVL